MPRVFGRTLSVLATALSLIALTAVSAQAKKLHVAGQQTTITPSAQVTKFLAAQNITASALGTATIANASLTLPISGGFVTTPALNGVLRHTGGVKFTHGARSVALRGFVLARIAGRTFLSAKAGGARLIVARVTKLTKTISGKQGVITGELKLSAAAARRINRLIGHHVASAGLDIGSLTSTVTVG